MLTEVTIRQRILHDIQLFTPKKGVTAVQSIIPSVILPASVPSTMTAVELQSTILNFLVAVGSVTSLSTKATSRLGAAIGTGAVVGSGSLIGVCGGATGAAGAAVTGVIGASTGAFTGAAGFIIVSRFFGNKMRSQKKKVVR